MFLAGSVAVMAGAIATQASAAATICGSRRYGYLADLDKRYRERLEYLHGWVALVNFSDPSSPKFIIRCECCGHDVSKSDHPVMPTPIKFHIPADGARD